MRIKDTTGNAVHRLGYSDGRGYGYCSGSGSGYGDGHGYGSGYGSGYGYGCNYSFGYAKHNNEL